MCSGLTLGAMLSATSNGDSHSQNNQFPSPLFFQVPEIIQLICFHIDRVTDKAAQSTIRKTFHLLVQSHTDEVILTLYKTENPSQRLPIPSATHLQAASCPFNGISVCARTCSNVAAGVCRCAHVCAEARGEVRSLPQPHRILLFRDKVSH